MLTHFLTISERMGNIRAKKKKKKIFTTCLIFNHHFISLSLQFTLTLNLTGSELAVTYEAGTVNIYRFAVQAHMRSEAEVAFQTDDLSSTSACCSVTLSVSWKQNVTFQFSRGVFSNPKFQNVSKEPIYYPVTSTLWQTTLTHHVLRQHLDMPAWIKTLGSC